jgi:hypothetical protein
MKFNKKKKYKPKDKVLDPVVHYCPLKLCRIERVVCGKVQSKKWNKCFNLSCEHLDSNAIMKEWQDYKERELDIDCD